LHLFDKREKAFDVQTDIKPGYNPIKL